MSSVLTDISTYFPGEKHITASAGLPIRYVAKALGLKFFSTTAVTRKLYRMLGNTVAARRRARLGQQIGHRQNGEWLVKQLYSLGFHQESHFRFLELGTGWLQFYSLYLKLHFPHAQGVAFDVWDNRSWDALQERMHTMQQEWLGLSDQQKLILEGWKGLRDIDEWNHRLGIEYIVNPEGALENLESTSIDIIVSMDVLEHIPQENLAQAIQEQHRILKRGGYAFHQIGLDDHLAHGNHANKRQFLSVSRARWKRYFQNRLQYFNCVPYSGFRCGFAASGFRELSASCERSPQELSKIVVDKDYDTWDQESLEAVRAAFVLQK